MSPVDAGHEPPRVPGHRARVRQPSAGAWRAMGACRDLHPGGDRGDSAGPADGSGDGRPRRPPRAHVGRPAERHLRERGGADPRRHRAHEGSERGGEGVRHRIHPRQSPAGRRRRHGGRWLAAQGAVLQPARRGGERGAALHRRRGHALPRDLPFQRGADARHPSRAARMGRLAVHRDRAARGVRLRTAVHAPDAQPPLLHRAARHPVRPSPSRASSRASSSCSWRPPGSRWSGSCWWAPRRPWRTASAGTPCSSG